MNKEITIETVKNPEIERIFNKIEKIPCVGRVLVSVFKENTVDWEIMNDNWRENHKIYGKVSKIKFGEHSPVMTLNNSHEGYDANLTIFDLTKSSPKEIEENEWHRQVVSFGAHIADAQSSYVRIYISVYFNWWNFRLPDSGYVEYNNWLREVVSSINTKAFQTHIREKKKELQEKNRKKELIKRYIKRYGEEKVKEYFGS